ncbi:N-acetylmuramoyl-L-alanine amidase [Stenotrophomonas sp.]|uniref:N-acetylmuramoyl-L-alanine amidase n=1 Tax=Stenotrophomonas sp. TaxID=69392 RepID=UPI00289DEEF0|nr:N-acetylmuramoyl-L-alanine amidase [Stenotrophomonas sp.]
MHALIGAGRVQGPCASDGRIRLEDWLNGRIWRISQRIPFGRSAVFFVHATRSALTKDIKGLDMNCMRILRLLGLVWLVTCAPAWSTETDNGRMPSMVADTALDLLLTREAQDILNRHQLRARRPLSASVDASVDIQQRKLSIRFGPGVLPMQDDHSLEEMEQRIRNTLEARALQAGVGEVETEVLYEGKLYWEHFPRDPATSMRASHAQAGDSVLVSASHGLLRVHPGLEWKFQRPESNGLLEDLVTPAYAEELQVLLQERGGLVVHQARRDSGAIHPESERPWPQMSARYHLKDLLPERTDIWNHFATSTATDREVFDDIRARPYYANHLGVGGLLSIHTNADVPGVARGARVYYHASKPGDRLLADLALCYMKEIITAQDGYADFPVPAAGTAAGHGENSFASMPSVVVEVAFHTNPIDAQALQDPLFRAASMKGVEKGYRMFREGKGCVPLKADPIQGIQLPQGGSQQVDVVFEGYPQYPIELVTTNVGCPPGWACADGRVRIETPDAKPSKITLRYDSAGSAPVLWDTQVVDADGVKSAPVRHWVQCIRGSRDSVVSPGVEIDLGAATAG